MAIIVEQEKKSVNWPGVVSGVIIILVLFVGGYFIFFKKPDLLDIPAPGGDSLTQLSRLSFKPENVINSPVFRSLRQFGTTISAETSGRTNPFKPF